MQQRCRAIIILLTIGISAWSGFLNLVHRSNNKKHQQQHQPQRRHRSLKGISSFFDPHTTVPKVNEKEQIWLNELKSAEPSISQHRPTEPGAVAVDVVSIGSQTRPAYLTAQHTTWASEARSFWGFTERQGFDPNCASMDDKTLSSFIATCRAERLGTKNFGGGHLGQAGWFCAQRRPGRALGWLQNVYQDGGVGLPDILIIADDDTSVDIEKVKEFVLREEYNDRPYIAAGSVFQLGKYDGFKAAHGGFGTFFNKAAVRLLTQPIHCDERQKGNSFLQNACAKIRNNRAGELDVFQQGDSTFDIFYKLAARQYFCMHSDWEMGYMITNYSGTTLEKVGLIYRKECTEESVSCHYQTPSDMEKFVATHPQVQ